jgi:hypothetical protein
MKTLDDVLYGLRVKIVCDDYNECFGTIIEVTDNARPFTVNVDYLGVTEFNTSELIILEDV